MIDFQPQLCNSLNTMPISEDDFSSPCPTPGCFGDGHAKGRKFETHDREENCPYSLENLSNDDLIPDRLLEKPCIFESPGYICYYQL